MLIWNAKQLVVKSFDRPLVGWMVGSVSQSVSPPSRLALGGPAATNGEVGARGQASAKGASECSQAEEVNRSGLLPASLYNGGSSSIGSSSGLFPSCLLATDREAMAVTVSASSVSHL